MQSTRPKLKQNPSKTQLQIPAPQATKKLKEQYSQARTVSSALTSASNRFQQISSQMISVVNDLTPANSDSKVSPIIERFPPSPVAL